MSVGCVGQVWELRGSPLDDDPWIYAIVASNERTVTLLILYDGNWECTGDVINMPRGFIDSNDHDWLLL